jgi:hypothetical protein
MDARAIQRAALITLRRAICERFPPGRERRAWLAWADRVQGEHACGTAWTPWLTVSTMHAKSREVHSQIPRVRSGKLLLDGLTLHEAPQRRTLRYSSVHTVTATVRDALEGVCADVYAYAVPTAPQITEEFSAAPSQPQLQKDRFDV